MYDDLPKLMYEGKMILPVRDSYTIRQPYGVVSTKQQGTLNRMNRSSYNGPSEISCSIHLKDYIMMQWWDSFYRYTIGEGSKRFICELLVNGVIKKHVAQIISDPRISSPGWKADVSLNLQVVPVINRCYDQSMALLLTCYGSKTPCFIDNVENVAKYLNGIWERN